MPYKKIEIDEPELLRFIEERGAEFSYGEIGERFGISESSVSRICRRTGIYKPRLRESRTAEVLRFVEERGAEFTYREIGERFGISESSVSRICRRTGIHKPRLRESRTRRIEDVAAEVLRIVEEQGDRFSVREIAEMFGISGVTLWKLCKRAGVKKTKIPRKTPGWYAEAQQLRAQGHTYKEIADKVGRAMSSVHNSLSSCGEPLVRRRTSKRTSKNTDEAELLRFIQVQGDRFSVREIAEMFEVSESRLYGLYKRAGIKKPRKTPGWIAEAQQLRAQGYTYREIADKLGYPIRNVHKNLSRRGEPLVRLIYTVPTDLRMRRRRQLYDEGLVDREIGALTGVTSNTIQTWRTRVGLPPNSPKQVGRPKIDLTWLPTARKLRKSGYTYQQIAHVVGVSVATVRKYLISMNTPDKP